MIKRPIASRLACAAAITFALACTGGSAAAQTPTRAFAQVGEHDPSGIVYALRYGADLVKNEKGAEFTLFLGGRGILLFLDVPGKSEGGKAESAAKAEYAALRPKQPKGMKVVACKEHVDMIKAKAKWPYVPLMAGISVAPCADIKKKLLAQGWRPIMGL